MRARRLRSGLKGWGGVGAMAVACALAVVLALLLPTVRSHGEPGGPGGARGGGSGSGSGSGGHGTAHGSQARAAEECTDPEKQTLAPSDSDGPAIGAIRDREGEKRKLVVGVDQNSFRWGYRDPNSRGAAELEGFDIDLVHRIAEDVLGDGNAVQFKAIPTDQRIPAIQDGRVDMVVRTMTINCDRLKDVAFSAPYFRTGQQVLAPKSSDVTGYDGTLAGKRICTAAGSTALSTLERDRKDGRLAADADLGTTVPNQLDCLVRLQLGEVDAVVTDGALAASQAAQDPTVELKGDSFTTEYYGVAMKKDADDLVRRVNRILADWRADRTDGWQHSYEAWLSETMDDAAKSEPPAPQYLRES
ncbi:glutamate ABC transporter substrate-binding protein [Streptomyces olivaceus]|uniref:glutamate ABC transporter substrate-binding protein n=1 Tax=Streptomyces olivaceus TaxID=47716 RepID=UPI001CCA843F|nr:glutamate ABC transporter substrate-binding protein [Streptomyces olivaceus]MBZ6294457.1 glutamate ABC transporter substrate-binding protein [Streptomyces olivaceus]MBZ6329422.1 glutamate ABC transporter substrate-binding protein [Streptomyces olivaceus]